jgi:hypothetical protein
MDVMDKEEGGAMLEKIIFRRWKGLIFRKPT